MKQSSGFDKFFMAKGKVITAINAEFGLVVMTVMDLPDSCLEHGLRLYCNKSAILPSRSALPDHQLLFVLSVTGGLAFNQLLSLL